MWFLAQQVEQATDVAKVESHYGNLIFTLCFFLAAILVGIWWLRRNA
jgi:hypothetical protein